MLEIIGTSFQTPANGARSFTTQEVAKQLPLGSVQFCNDTLNPFIFNMNFDEKLILFDSNYNSTVADFSTQTDIPLLFYFHSILHHLPLNPTIIEIGAGQGELITELRDRGFNARGFDPVLQKPTEFLFKNYWNPNEELNLACDLFILRCVLPHIKDPFVFLQKIFAQYPDASILIEYQRIEYMHQHKLWFNLGHGHVNQFTLQDFQNRFNIIEFGEFKGGEWQWLLINQKKLNLFMKNIKSNTKMILSELIEEKSNFLIRASSAGPFAIYGAAGKGIILAEALVSSGVEVVCAIDLHESKLGRYLEVSGIQVVSPKTAHDELSHSVKILVCNPNQLRATQFYFNRGFNVILPGEL